MSIANSSDIDASSGSDKRKGGGVRAARARARTSSSGGVAVGGGGGGGGSIDLAELLSTCVDACRRGCEVIRNVRHRSLQSAEFAEGVRYKIVGDPRSALTEADGASQKVIVECLNCCWEREIESGRLKVVGEEDADHYSTDLEGERSFDTAYSEDIMNHFDNYGSPRPDVEPMRRDIFGTEAMSDAGVRREARSSAGDQIIVFIDPMDGTREFVEGRIHNVQCLIGITLNGRPVAGAMGLPMVHENQIEIAYGLIQPSKGDSAVVPVLSGVKFFDAANPLDLHTVKDDAGGESDECDGDEILRVFSGDSKKPALKMAMDCLENEVLKRRLEPGNTQEASGAREAASGHDYPSPPIRKIVSGGCGNKILSVQRHAQRLSQRREEDRIASYAASCGCCGVEEYIPASFAALAPPPTPPPPTVGAISVAPPGSSSWDTAAPTAVLLAADPGARVTDLLGRPLRYNGEDTTNSCGVVVSSGSVASSVHDRLCRGLGADPKFRETLGVVVDEVVTPASSAESR